LLQDEEDDDVKKDGSEDSDKKGGAQDSDTDSDTDSDGMNVLVEEGLIVEGLFGDAADELYVDPEDLEPVSNTWIVAYWQGQAYATIFTMQLGFFLVLPLIFEYWAEFNLQHAIMSAVLFTAAGSWCFFLFTMQTKAYFFKGGITYGSAQYVATGRGYAMDTTSFVKLFTLYADSHIYAGIEVFLFICIYFFFTNSPIPMVNTWSMWTIVFSLTLAPWVFNPQSLRIMSVYNQMLEFVLWVDAVDKQALKATALKETWYEFHQNRMKIVRGVSAEHRIFELGKTAIPRIFFFLSCAVAFKVRNPEDSPNPTVPIFRTVMLVSAGIIMQGLLGLLFVLSSPHTIGRVVDLSGKQWPYSLYVLSMRGIMFVVWLTVLEIVYEKYVVMDSKSLILFTVSSVIFNSSILQVVAYGPWPDPWFLKKLGWTKESRIGKRWASVGTWLRKYADFTYQLQDTLIGYFITAGLFGLSVLPLTALQSAALFNGNMADILTEIMIKQDLMWELLIK